MGCGCNRRKNRKRQQSSRMPSTPSEPKKVRRIRGIKVPENMTHNERRSTIAKIKNGEINKAKNKTVADYVKERKSLEG